jgi:hypothetical protein
MNSYDCRASDSLRNVHADSCRSLWNKCLGKLQLSKRQLNIGSSGHRAELGCDPSNTVFGIQENVLGLVELNSFKTSNCKAGTKFISFAFLAFRSDNFNSAKYPPIFNLNTCSKLRFQTRIFRKRRINVFVVFQIHQLDA